VPTFLNGAFHGRPLCRRLGHALARRKLDRGAELRPLAAHKHVAVELGLEVDDVVGGVEVEVGARVAGVLGAGGGFVLEGVVGRRVCAGSVESWD